MSHEMFWMTYKDLLIFLENALRSQLGLLGLRIGVHGIEIIMFPQNTKGCGLMIASALAEE